MSRVGTLLRRGTGRVREDIEADPWLRYVLALAILTCGFGIWFRVPNFADPDEYSRLVQPMKVAGAFVSDPGFDAIQRAITDGRALGATFYLYALVLVPVFFVVFASGQLGEFATLGTLESRWDLWHEAPAWFWTSSVVLGRFINVGLGVGCVYLTYRLGIELRDRYAGRLAGISLALSVGFFSQTHLVGEDVPMLFLLLATVLLATRYARTGRAGYFLVGCLTGGLAIAFKLTGGVAALLLGVAHLQYAVGCDEPKAAIVRPKLLGGGFVVGFLAVYVGIPSVLVGGPTVLVDRVLFGLGTKTGKAGGIDAPAWYWLLRQSLRALGWPLFLVATVGAVGSLRSAVRDRTASPLWTLLVVGVAIHLLVFSTWEFLRLRHVVPMVPLVVALAAAEASRLRTEHPRVVRIVLVVTAVGTVAFAGMALADYTNDPRDEAAKWTETHAGPDDQVEVYENSVADVGIPHGTRTIHYEFQEENATHESSLVRNESAYTEWMLDMPRRQPTFIQLTDREFEYLDPRNPRSERFPERATYVDGLLDGEYNYTVAAEFGDRPRHDSTARRLVRAGIYPNVEGRSEVVVVLERR